MAVPLKGDDILRSRPPRALDSPCRENVFKLPGERASAGAARREVRRRLAEWGFASELVEDAELVVSELVANAVEHARTAEVGCVLRIADGLVCLEVTDNGRATQGPCPRPAGLDQLNGRGLALVAAYADEWGVTPAEDGSGHTVWATLRVGAAEPAPPRLVADPARPGHAHG